MCKIRQQVEICCMMQGTWIYDAGNPNLMLCDKGWTRWLDYIWLNEHEFEQTLGDSEGQGSLACCSP